jgi:hypothetical protein
VITVTAIFPLLQELERAWRECDKLECEVTITRDQMQEQLGRLGEVQVWSELFLLILTVSSAARNRLCPRVLVSDKSLPVAATAPSVGHLGSLEVFSAAP